MNILDFNKYKNNNKKITMVTCYDYASARIIEQSDMDCVLVGDSVAMVMHGFDNTLSATPEMMALHTQSVSKGIKSKFIITDMPFLAIQLGFNKTIEITQTLFRAGAQAVKIEGASSGTLDTIKKLVQSGIPVMGHLGLTPQYIHQLGGFRAQGKDESSQEIISTQARELEKAGCFSLVLECMPRNLANQITSQLTIPTIGIGAGPDTDGQVLVLQDLLGLSGKFQPTFLKKYLDGEELVLSSLNNYVTEVRNNIFPEEKHCYANN